MRGRMKRTDARYASGGFCPCSTAIVLSVAHVGSGVAACAGKTDNWIGD